MNTASSGMLAWLGATLAFFLILSRRAPVPRSAQDLRERLLSSSLPVCLFSVAVLLGIHVIREVAAPPEPGLRVPLALCAATGWFVLPWLILACSGLDRAAGLSRPLPRRLAWLLCLFVAVGLGTLAGTRGVLILLTSAGSVFLMRLFPSRFDGDEGLRGTGARFAAGLAWASLWISSGATSALPAGLLLLLGGICALAPDSLDHWGVRLFQQIDIHVVSDPLQPMPGLVSEALAHAILVCRSEQRRIRVEIYPWDEANRWVRQTIAFDNRSRRVTVAWNGDAATTPFAASLASDHPFRMEIGEDSLTLDLRPRADGRIQITPTPWKQGWSHSLAAALGAGALAWCTAGSVAGMVCAGAWIIHSLIDHCGFAGVAWAFPRPRQHAAGLQWRQLRPSAGFHLGLIWLGGLVAVWNVTRAAHPGMFHVSVVPLILCAGITPLLLWRRWGAARQRETPAPSGSAS